MQLPSYLTLSRHNIYYYRFPLPKQIHPKQKASFIRLSLGTTNEREALYTSNRLTYHAEALLDRLQSDDMKYDEIKNNIKDGLTKLIKEGKAQRLENGAYDKNQRKAMENWVEQYGAYNPDDYYEGDVIVANANRKIADMLSKLDIPEPAKKQFTLEFIRQYPEALNALLKFNANPDDINFGVSNTITHHETQTSLHDTIEKYIAENIRSENWKYHTEQERRKSFNALLDILGHDFILENLTKEEARKVRDVITTLPVNWRGNKKTRDLTIIEASKNNDIPKISQKTVNEYMGTYIAFGNWCSDMGYIAINSFSGMKAKIKRKGKERDAFTIDQIQLILSAIDDEKIRKGRKQFKYWGVMIAAYTGARREEVCQMTLDDIVNEEGVWCFDINDNGEHKKLKTESSKRIIPIHSTILDKGFIDYVDDLKRNKHTRLFPELKYIEKHGYGRNLGTWFNGNFLKKLELKTDKLVFHSLRHTVTTQLYETGAEDSMVKKIRGSSDGNDVALKYYDHSKRIKLMKETLEKLPY